MGDITKLKVLVVDDMATMRRIVSDVLKEMGISNIGQAASATEGAAQLIEAHKTGAPYNLILSDWNMPELSGLEFLKLLRSKPTFKDIPFIMVTSEDTQENLTEAAAQGVSAYVKKPLNSDDLRGKIEAIFP